MSAHTPGPWETNGLHGREVWGRDFTGNLKAITERVRGGSPEQAQANARLIAAAPDLLEAARHFSACDMAGTSLEFRCKGCTAGLTAIAKAVGQ